MAGKAAAMRPTGEAVEDVLARVADPERRVDAEMLVELMRAVTGEPPVVWASRIVGFGRYAYTYPSGHSGSAPRAGFAAGGRELVISLMPDFQTVLADDLARLGRHRAGKGCLYIKRLSDVDLDVLRGMVQRAADE